MKYLLGFLLLFPLTLLAAETVVVKDVLPINVRSGAGTGHGIVAAAKSGERLVVLDKKPGYVKVRTPKEKEGWVLSRFVQTEPVARELLQQAVAKKEKAETQYQEAQAALDELRASHAELEKQYAALQTQHLAVSSDLKQVSEAAASTLEIQQRNEELQAEVVKTEEARQKMQDHMDYRQIRRSNMLLGAGILLAGLLIGLIVPLLRPRKSSWA